MAIIARRFPSNNALLHEQFNQWQNASGMDPMAESSCEWREDLNSAVSLFRSAKISSNHIHYRAI